MDQMNDVSELEARYFKRDYCPSSNLAICTERVSTEKQKMKSSLHIQKKGGNEYTKSKNLHVVETHSIAETAFRHEERKVFIEIINIIKKSHKTKNKIMHWVFSHASRASRNKKSTNLLRNLVLYYGVVLHYYRDGLVLHQASDQATWDRWEKLHACSEEENNERRMNSLKGMLAKYERGIPLQRSPFGYKSIKVTSEDSGYVFNPPYSSYVERAFSLAASGDLDFKRKLDIEFIGVIEGKQIPTDRQLATVLRDPFYYGGFRVKDIVYAADPRFLPPLIKKSLWSKVQLVLDGKSRNTRSKKINLAYTGTMKCGGDILDEAGNPTGEICGGSISGEVKRDKDVTWGCGCTRKNCSQRNAGYMKSLGSQRYFSNDKIEEMLLGVMKDIPINDGMLVWLNKKVEATVLEQGDFSKNKVSKTQSSITKKEGIRKKLLMQKAMCKVSPAEYEEFDRELVDEIVMLKKQLEELQHSKVENDWIQEAIMEKLTDLAGTFKKSEGHIKNKMVLSFCDKVVLRQGHLIPDWKSFIDNEK